MPPLNNSPYSQHLPNSQISRYSEVQRLFRLHSLHPQWVARNDTPRRTSLKKSVVYLLWIGGTRSSSHILWQEKNSLDLLRQYGYCSSPHTKSAHNCGSGASFLLSSIPSDMLCTGPAAIEASIESKILLWPVNRRLHEVFPSTNTNNFTDDYHMIIIPGDPKENKVPIRSLGLAKKST